MTLDDTPEVLRPREVAKFLRVSPQRVYALLESGSIAAVRYGKCWLVPRESLKRFIANITNRLTK